MPKDAKRNRYTREPLPNSDGSVHYAQFTRRDFEVRKLLTRNRCANAERDLPGLVGELIEQLALHRAAQHRTFERYKGTLLTDQQADHAILGMYREAIINIQRIPDVLKEWSEPSFEEFQTERSAWRLFNAATFALTGKVVENPQATPKLHKVIVGFAPTSTDGAHS